jgi:hypothetical protein
VTDPEVNEIVEFELEHAVQDANVVPLGIEVALELEKVGDLTHHVRAHVVPRLVGCAIGRGVVRIQLELGADADAPVHLEREFVSGGLGGRRRRWRRRGGRRRCRNVDPCVGVDLDLGLRRLQGLCGGRLVGGSILGRCQRGRAEHGEGAGKKEGERSRVCACDVSHGFPKRF